MLPDSQVESSTRGRRAFTLIELLVVVAILGLLFSLLLPALNRGKDTSKRAVCLNNLKQLTAAWHFYCDDNDDRPPMNMQASQLDSVASNWVWNVMTYETGAVTPPATLADSADKALLVNSKSRC